MNEDNKIFKTNEFSIEISPVGKAIQSKDIQYFSYDENSGLQLIHILMDGKPLDLPNGTEIRLSAVKLNNQNQKLIYTPEIVDPLKGIVSFVIPREFLGYRGEIRCGLYINFSNNQTMHVGYFYINMGVSDIDTNLTEFTEDFWQGWSEFEAGSTAKMQELEQRIDEQTEIFNNADVYNKAEIEDKLELFALRTDIDSLSIEKADKTDLALTDSKVADLDSVKADKTQVATKAEKTYVDSMLSSIAQGGPRELFYSLTALKTKYPNGSDGTYLVFDSATTDGAHSYMWDASTTSWKDLGIYQATAIANEAINTDNIIDAAVTNAKLSDIFGYSGYVSAGQDINAIRKEGVYLVDATALNLPEGIKSLTHLINHNANNRWFMQTLLNYDSTNKVTSVWVRRFDLNQSNYGVWTEIYSTSVIESLSTFKKAYTTKSGADLNSTKSNSNLFVSSAINYPKGAATVGFLSTDYISDNFQLQNYYDRDGGFYYRFIDALRNPDINDNPFKRVLTVDDLSSVNKPLSGKVVVNFGDSIVDRNMPSNDISSMIATISGATAHNVGFGGCRMATGKYPRPWEAFSMVSLARAIVSKDWSAQDTAIADTSQGYPTYFPTKLALIKSLDFNKVDYVTIRYGTNDWNASVYLDNPENKYDEWYLTGCLRISLELLMEAYPHLRFLIQTPGYRFWMDSNGEFIEDSDTKLNTNNDKLTDFVEQMIKVAKEYKIPYQDDYHMLGFNKFNRKKFFDATDGVHPNVSGTRIIGEKTAYSLINLV